MKILVMDENKQWVSVDLSEVLYKKTANGANTWRNYSILENGIFNIKVDTEWEKQDRE